MYVIMVMLFTIYEMVGGMRNRLFQRANYTNREYVLLSRKRTGGCLYCPPHAGDNAYKGELSNWGRKVAAKRQYATGKGRKEKRYLFDKHYADPTPRATKRRLMYEEIDYGEMMYIVKEIGRKMYKNPGQFAGQLLRQVNNEFTHEGAVGWENGYADMSFKVRAKRKNDNN